MNTESGYGKEAVESGTPVYHLMCTAHARERAIRKSSRYPAERDLFSFLATISSLFFFLADRVPFALSTAFDFSKNSRFANVAFFSCV